MKFALHGPLFSGKTTLAEALVREGYTLIDYTGELKRRYVRALTCAGVPTTLDEVLAHKEEERAGIIWLGSRIGFDQGALVDELVGEAGDPEHAVFDNVRFPVQYEKLQVFGYRLVRLVLPPAEQEARAYLKGISGVELRAKRSDLTELPLPAYLDEIVLDARRPTQELVDELLGRGTDRLRAAA